MKSMFQCRSCGGKIGVNVLDLGIQPLANNLLQSGDLDKPEPKFPLRLALCQSCWLLQITDLVPPVELFSEYLYFSSFSDAMLRHAKEAAERYIHEFQLGRNSCVMEIASNDGYLLQNFVRACIPCLGIEPAKNIAKVAVEKGVPTLCEFFGECLGVRLAGEGRQADLVLGNNVFAHAPLPNDFVAGIRAVLKPEGRAILEFPYAVDMVDHSEFDTIYHEHVFYFTLTALVPLFRRHGLEIYHVERLVIHGGSLRLFAGQVGVQPIRATVTELLAEEARKGVATLEYYAHFAQQAGEIKRSLKALLSCLLQEGKQVAAYGASAKGSTLLNFSGVGRDEISFVVDRSTYKVGRFTPGTHLPILAPEELVERAPDYTLLLTWNFADEILRQQQVYRSRGGRFIVPIPQVQVI